MGRKHSFIDLPAGEQLTAVNSSESAAAATPSHLSGMSSRGAIGAVTRSIEQMRANSILDLTPETIETSAISDRLGGTVEDHKALVASIREHGQQVPILVRPHPEREGRYQIAYGRRRLRALTELGRPIRAIVRPLTDQQLVVAQGQENTARTDLSFIERALFSAKLEQGGYDRETIMAALSVDKTTLSRLISAASKVPRSVIEAIGPAPKAGRDRWVQLATRLEATGCLQRVEQLIADETFAAKPSDGRFAAVLAATVTPPATVPLPKLVKAADGTPVARIKEDAANLVVALDKQAGGGFAAYLVAQLPNLYAAFTRRGDELTQDGKDKTNP